MSQCVLIEDTVHDYQSVNCLTTVIDVAVKVFIVVMGDVRLKIDDHGCVHCFAHLLRHRSSCLRHLLHFNVARDWQHI